MAGIYKIGFRDGTPFAEAADEALARIRQEGDDDEVTAGPEVVQSDAHREAGEILVRIVTGVPDPVPALQAAEVEQQAAAAQDVVGRLLELPPAKLAALGALLDKI